jgi:hypothetical protein
LCDKWLITYGKDCNKQRKAWINKTEPTPLAADQVVEMDLMKQIQLHGHQAIDQIKVEKKVTPKKRDTAAIIFKQHERQTTTCQVYVRRTQAPWKTFWKPKELLSNIEPSDVYPLKSQQIDEAAFGKPNTLKSYTATPAIQSILCLLFKSHYLTKRSIQSICRAIPNDYFLYTKIQEYAQWDFRCLRHPNFDWEAQEVNNNREKHCNACLIHYDCSIEAV